MDFKRTFTRPVPESRERSFTKAGIDQFHGRAKFVGLTSIQVGKEVLEAKNVVIATDAMACAGLRG